jgi:hypothetical protein
MKDAERPSFPLCANFMQFVQITHKKAINIKVGKIKIKLLKL